MIHFKVLFQSKNKMNFKVSSVIFVGLIMTFGVVMGQYAYTVPTYPSVYGSPYAVAPSSATVVSASAYFSHDDNNSDDINSSIY